MGTRPVQDALDALGAARDQSEEVARWTAAAALRRGNVGVMPMMFFLLSFVLASIGPGNIASTAIIAPMGMAVAGQVGIPAFLMAIMIGNGANAGSLSPIAPTGVIVNGVMDDIRRALHSG